MKGEEFSKGILAKIKETLSDVGLPDIITEQIDVVIYVVLIILIAFIAGKFTHLISSYIIRRLQKRKTYALLAKLVEYNVLKKISLIIPPIIIIWLLPVAFTSRPKLAAALENIAWIYFIITIVRMLTAIFSSIGSMAYTNRKYHDKPIKGFVQITQIVVYLISVIVIISILTNKSPFYLIGGLGAFAAVIMLIFKDTIMGFVAGILLLENDMVRLGDWIELPNSAINGTVIDISLTIVKVRNFDNTIATITVAGGAATTKYDCTFDYSITTTNNTTADRAAAALTALKADGDLTLSAGSGISLSKTAYSLGEDATGTGSFTMTGTGSANIGATITFTNTAVSQNAVANAAFSTTITVNNFSCDVS